MAGKPTCFRFGIGRACEECGLLRHLKSYAYMRKIHAHVAGIMTTERASLRRSSQGSSILCRRRALILLLGQGLVLFTPGI
jgi:hypothetical protein